MKFRITMKDPDAPYEAVNEAARKSVALIEGLSEGEREVLIEQRMNEGLEFIKQWIEHGEYVTIDIDAEAKTVVVLKAEQ